MIVVWPDTLPSRTHFFLISSTELASTPLSSSWKMVDWQPEETYRIGLSEHGDIPSHHMVFQNRTVHIIWWPTIWAIPRPIGHRAKLHVAHVSRASTLSEPHRDGTSRNPGCIRIFKDGMSLFERAAVSTAFRARSQGQKNGCWQWAGKSPIMTYQWWGYHGITGSRNVGLLQTRSLIVNAVFSWKAFLHLFSPFFGVTFLLLPPLQETPDPPLKIPKHPSTQPGYRGSNEASPWLIMGLSQSRRTPMNCEPSHWKHRSNSLKPKHMIFWIIIYYNNPSEQWVPFFSNRYFKIRHK